MNELIITDKSIEFTQGIVKFNDYLIIKQQAEEVAEYVKQQDVTEDNVKESKKLLAAVNKSVKKLEDGRISIKKAMLEPYIEFEAQIKDIVSIVKDADKEVRDKVKELEEKERDDKEIKIREIWNKRIMTYENKDLMNFEDWIQPSYLNKSISLKQVEGHMTDWMEKVEKELDIIKTLSNNTEVMTEYLSFFDLAEAMNIVNEREKRSEVVKEIIKEVAEDEDKEYMFVVKGKDNKELIEKLLNQMNITYTLK